MYRSIFIILTTMIIIAITSVGCYAGISGIVVDAATHQPIEGAVVLIEWTKTKGVPGMAHNEVYKTLEIITDTTGKFKAESIANPLVNPPIIAIYKKGFVIWSNRYDFPSWKKKTEVTYDKELEIKLDPFKQNFSHTEHVAFISSAAISGSGGIKFAQAYLWEWQLAQQEKIKFKKQEKEGR